MKTLRFALLCMVLVVTASALSAAEPPSAGAQWWGRAPGQKPAIAGDVDNVSATRIGIKTPQGVKQFTVDGNTKVFIEGKAAGIGDIKIGDFVRVRFKPVPNGVPLALAIHVPKPGVKGKIASIDGRTFVIKNKQGQEWHVTTTDQTTYRSHGYQGTFADLRVGYGAAVQGAITGQDVTADRIEFVPAMAKGAVVAKDGDVITVKTVRQRAIVTLGSPATAVLIRPRIGPNKKGALADIQVGMPCNIGFHPNPRGQSPLLWIDLLVGQ